MRSGVFLMTVMGFVLYGSTVLLPILLQTLLGYSALDAGFAMLPRGLGSFIAMPLVGILMSKIEPRKLLAVGFSVAAASMWSALEDQLECGLLGHLLASVRAGYIARISFRAADHHHARSDPQRADG